MFSGEKPLDGITVVDLTQALSGPICACLLADYGAHVIKVEERKGDSQRGFEREEDKKGHSPSNMFRNFSAINRNKDSICLNVRDPECMAILKELIRHADILLSNYRPGTTKKMGIDYETLKQENERLICCEISAFREKGRELEPGYDVVVQAASGIIASTGYPGQPPCKPGPSMADMAAGNTMFQGILLALLERAKTGRGQSVKVRMQDAAMFMMAQYCTPLIDDPDYEFQPNGMAHVEATPSNGFETSDGYIFTAPAGTKLFPVFCNLIGKPELLTDPRFTPKEKLIENRNILYDEILGPMFRSNTTEYWYRLLSGAGLPVSPIATPKEAWRKAAEQGAPIVAAVQHARYGEMHLPGTVIELSDSPGSVDRPAPWLGEHTEKVLRDLGISDEKIRALEERQAIYCYRESSLT